MIEDCKLVKIPSFHDERGSLSFLQKDNGYGFDIERVYYLYHAKINCIRGVHAHKKLEQVIVSLHGEFEITLDDGVNRRVFNLKSPDVGLYVCPMIWREVRPVTDGGVCMVLASRRYEPEDYIHNYDEFSQLVELL